MNDVRMAKFETLIEDIDSKINAENLEKPSAFALIMGAKPKRSIGMDKNIALALIYDYGQCNEYAKIIMNKSTIYLINESGNYEELWNVRYPSFDVFNNTKTKIDAAKDFVKYCRQSQNSTEGYKFIFWALMVLTVDKTNAEEHLSLICDFAQMLHISDAEFEDILQTIKIIYNELEEEYIFKSENIPSIFGSLFNLYGNSGQ